MLVTNDQRELHNNPKERRRTTRGTRGGSRQAPLIATCLFYARMGLDDVDRGQDVTIDNGKSLRIKALERCNEERVWIPSWQQHLGTCSTATKESNSQWQVVLSGKNQHKRNRLVAQSEVRGPGVHTMAGGQLHRNDLTSCGFDIPLSPTSHSHRVGHGD